MGVVTGEQGTLEGQSHKADPNLSMLPVAVTVAMLDMMAVLVVMVVVVMG